MRNFTAHPASPSAPELIRYAERAEEHGFDSLWVWDHLLLGSAHPFPVFDSLSTLAAVAVRTDRILLGTGVLVLPLRNPVELAKVSTTIDHLSNGRLILGVAAGWYEKEFAAAGVPFRKRGEVMERNLDVLRRFWTEHEVSGEAGEMVFHRAVMLPKPVQRPRPLLLMGGYVDHVLRRVATRSDGWLTYFYRVEDFSESWQRIRDYAEAAGRDPDTLHNAAQLPFCVADSFDEADRRVHDFLTRNFDEPEWSRVSFESAVRGTVEQCIEQLLEHVAAGVQHLILVPCEYDDEQVDVLATEIIPKLRSASPPAPSPAP
jgi:alkanesulfonate monooxygenase